MPTLSLKNALINGLRPSVDLHRNTDFLTGSYNCRHLQYGAGIFNGIQQPVSIAVGHPFPQIFVGKKKILMVKEDRVVSLSDVYGETAYSLYDQLDSVTGHLTYSSNPLSPSTNIATGGGVWHFAEIGDNFFLCNGQDVIIQSTDYTGTLRTATTSLQASDSNFPVFPLSVCELNGRFIFAGLANLVSTAFDTAMNVGNYSGYDTSDLTDRDIYWSSFGGSDAFWWFFTTMITDPDEAMQTLQRNEHGFATVPWRTSVWIVKPLGEGFMAYGEHGISYFRQNGLGFDQVDLAQFGVYDRGSVGGSVSEHLFLSTEGALWKIRPDLKLERLDYSELFDDFVTAGTDVTISYAHQMNEYYISNATISYLLTPYGLSQSPEIVTSVAQHLGDDVGFYEPYIDTDATMSIMTDTFDMGDRKVKTIKSLEFIGNDPSDFRCRIHYNMDVSTVFDVTSWVTPFSDGLVNVAASGVEFIIEAEAAAGAGKSIDDILINYNYGKKVLAL